MIGRRIKGRKSQCGGGSSWSDVFEGGRGAMRKGIWWSLETGKHSHLEPPGLGLVNAL